MSNTFEGTITKLINQSNLMTSFIDAMTNGNNEFIKDVNTLVYSENTDWNGKDDDIWKKSSAAIVANYDLNDSSKIISYSLPTRGFAWTKREIVNKKTEYKSKLYKTYNRIYFSINPQDIGEIAFEFNRKGINFNTFLAMSDFYTISGNYSPNIACGIITEKRLKDNEQKIEEYLNQPDSAFEHFYDFVNIDTYNSEQFTSVIDLRDFKNEEKIYIVITNIESGELIKNPEYDPDKDNTDMFKPQITYSAPDLIDIKTTIYNKAPTVPTDIEFSRYEKPEYDYPMDELIEGVPMRVTWSSSIDEDDTPEKDTLNMGKFILPLSLCKGDINKDGKIDKEDLEKLEKILEDNKVLIDDDFGLWAAVLSDINDTESNENNLEKSYQVLSNHLDKVSLILPEVYTTKLWESKWKRDLSKNLYYFEIEDSRITPLSKIELYNEYFYNLNTFHSIVCEEGKFRVYATACPTGINFFVQEHYDSTLNGAALSAAWEKEKEKDYLQVEYKIIEEYKSNVLRKSKQDTITYELTIAYDTEKIETYWIFPKNKNYMDIPFIQDLYYEYNRVYKERTEEENLKEFLKILPKTALMGYELNNEGKLSAVLPLVSEEEQAKNNDYMFIQSIVAAELYSIDYYGEKSNSYYKICSNKILYPTNVKPTPPSKVQILQNSNEISLIGSGSIDSDKNLDYKNPIKDIIRYEYQYYNEDKQSYESYISKKWASIKKSEIISLGDYAQRGIIDDFSLIRLSAYMYGSYIPTEKINKLFVSLTKDQEINEKDIDILKKYINNKDFINFPALDLTSNEIKTSEYKFIDDVNNWRLIPNDDINNKDVKGLYETYFEFENYNNIKGNIKIDISILNSNNISINNLIVKGKLDLNKNRVYLYFKSIPQSVLFSILDEISIYYSITPNPTNEINIVNSINRYPTPATFTINKQSDEVEYITVRARATDRMTWSDWKEFEVVAYPDIWLGTRNYINITGLSLDNDTPTPDTPTPDTPTPDTPTPDTPTPDTPTPDTPTLEIPSPVSDFVVNGVDYTANLSWTNPTDSSYYETVIIQKIDSEPTSITDGDEIYRGIDNKFIVNDLNDSITYYWAAFSVNKNNEYAENYPIGTYTVLKPADITLYWDGADPSNLTGGFNDVGRILSWVDDDENNDEDDNARDFAFVYSATSSIFDTKVIHLNASCGDNRSIRCYKTFVNKIDVTNFESIEITYVGSKRRVKGLIALTNKNSNWEGTTDDYVCYKTDLPVTANNTPLTYTLNCSNVTGKHYLLLGLDLDYGSSGDFYVSKIIAHTKLPVTPISYTLISTHTETQTIQAPEDGWYQLEIHGQSGKGGEAASCQRKWSNTHYDYYVRTGGGGGGSAYVLSNMIKMNKDDTIDIVYDSSGNITATINSSTGDVYDVMKAIAGKKGGDAICNPEEGFYIGEGGAGGEASGGNVTNINGNNGNQGARDNCTEEDGNGIDESYLNASGGSGGAPGHLDGNFGGKGEGMSQGEYVPEGDSKPGFVNFYRGNTNIVEVTT